MYDNRHEIESKGVAVHAHSYFIMEIDNPISHS
jgi:hypothetical protein